MHRCPVAAFRKMISGKYKLRLLWDLQNGPRRYGELKSGLLRGTEETKEIAQRVLSRELKALAASGLIARRDYGAESGISADANGPQFHFRSLPKFARGAGRT
jgi:DNA-binding HxlR family transcriptional regulator